MFNDRFLFDFGPHDVWTMFHSFCFDFSVWEIYGALLYGGKLIIVPRQTAVDTPAFLRSLAAEGVTVLNQTPSAFYNLMDEDLNYGEEPLNLKYIIFGGEALSPARLLQWKTKHPHTRLINMYGITETTVHVTFKEIGLPEIQDGAGNIGRPIPTLTAYVMDSRLKLLPIGIPGELCVGGKGVARGYLNRPELTADKFVQNPYNPQERLYRSGDLALITESGDLEYMGRIDSQVKIRGFRIELGEIEALLLSRDDITSAVVAVKTDGSGDNFLCAYVIPLSDAPFDPDAFDPDPIREFLIKDLPDYMVPLHFVPLEQLPLTSNGKIDKKALPDPAMNLFKERYVAPADPIQKKLVEIWSEVLGVEPHLIGIDNNFFEAGGHSLKATSLVLLMHKVFDVKIPLSEIFTSPTIRELSTLVKEAVQVSYIAVDIAEEREYYPLSAAQNRFYILDQIDTHSTAYNVPRIIPLEAAPHKAELEETFKKLIARHDSLRTSFHMIDGGPVQKIHKAVDFAVTEDRVTQEISHQQAIEDFIRPFDLTRPPLLRIALLHLHNQRCLLLADMPHIISDGVSQTVLTRDFSALSRNEELPSLNLQYKDFAVWENLEEQRELFARQEAYWLDVFAHDVPVLHLPTDFNRPAIQNFEGRSVPFTISPAQTAVLKKIALREGATLFMVLLALLDILLAKLSGQETVCVGTPIAGRPHADLQQIIGSFVNTLALKNSPLGEYSFSKSLEILKKTTLEAFENQGYQFESLVDKVVQNRDISRNPLFDVIFTFHNVEHETAPHQIEPHTPQEEMETLGEESEKYERKNKIAKFDLTFAALHMDGKIKSTFLYARKLFKEETVKRFIAYFQNIITAVTADPNIRINQMEIITPQEKEQLLRQFSTPDVSYPTHHTLHGLFSRQAAQTPDAVALVDTHTNRSVPYGELDQLSAQLGARLHQKGIRANRIVGIMMDPSIQLAVALLAVLKTGAAYVPLNQNAPAGRARFILTDCAIPLILTTRSLAPNIDSDVETIYLDDPAHDPVLHDPAAPGPHSLPETTDPRTYAYVIYTSGSTGTPKGVPITHANVSPLLHWGYRHLGIGVGDRALQNLSYYFDWSVWEIFITLTTGACLYVPPGNRSLEPADMIAFINTNNITILHATPTQYGYLARTGDIAQTLKYLFIGAEKLTHDLVRRAFRSVGSHCRLFNMYGPTEATIISCVLEIDPRRPDAFAHLSSVPIGIPVANMQCFILDAFFHVCPIGVVGELVIGGPGVAAGYLNNPSVTAEKFIHKQLPIDPDHPQPIRLYRTGDLVKWLPDGNIEYLARNDQQVKIRGFRIELGEINNAILKHPDVEEAVVIDYIEDDGEPYLCAYIVPAKNAETETGNETGDAPLNPETLRDFLARLLPDYMIPSCFMSIQKLPLNPNGKIERKALPAPVITDGDNYFPPRNPTEKALADIWSRLLEIERIGINDNFFHLGGHSLKATVLVSNIHKQLNIKLPLADIFKMPTIRELAQHIQTLTRQTFSAIPPTEKKDYYVASSAQKRLYLLQQIHQASTAYNLPQIIELTQGIQRETLESIFKRLIQRHDSLRTYFHEIEGHPVQKIHPRPDFSCLYYEPPDHEADQLVKDFVQPFDLARPPLLRVAFIKTPADRILLMMDMHHSISDGVSMSILEKEFDALYRNNPLPPLSLQYRDYAQWQQAMRADPQSSLNKQQAYWLSVFQDGVPQLKLPVDPPETDLPVFVGGNVSFQIDPQQTQQLGQLALHQGTTLYMILLTIFNILLARLSDTQDIVVGTAVSGRSHADLENIIGMLVNTLVLRNVIHDHETFTDCLQRVNKRTLAAFENQDYPFEDLVQHVAPNQAPGSNPIFDVMFSYHDTQSQDSPNHQTQDTPPPNEKQYRYNIGTAQFPLTLACLKDSRRIFCVFEYAAGFFKEDTITRFVDYFREIKNAILENKDILLKDVVIDHSLSDQQLGMPETEFDF